MVLYPANIQQADRIYNILENLGSEFTVMFRYVCLERCDVSVGGFIEAVGTHLPFAAPYIEQPVVKFMIAESGVA